MRSSAEKSGTLFSYVDLESRIPEKHPLRTIPAIVNEALASLDGEFGELCSSRGQEGDASQSVSRPWDFWHRFWTAN